jgi:hypothetical protein
MFNLRSQVSLTVLAAVTISALLAVPGPAPLQAQQGVKGLDDPAYIGKWDFEEPGSFGDWKALQPGTFDVDGGTVSVTAKSNRPCLDLTGPYSAEQISVIEVRIRGVEVQRNTEAGSGGGAMGGAGGRTRILPQLYKGTRIYFTRSASEKYDAENSIALDLPLDGKFHVLTITPADHPNWKGTLKKIRFDLGDFPHHYELDYIYFHRTPTSGGKDGASDDKAAGRAGAISTEQGK